MSHDNEIPITVVQQGRRAIPITVWRHADGREIHVFPTYKVRLTRDSVGRPLTDEWPVLYRRDVPNLSDDQWYGPPNETGWAAHFTRPEGSNEA